MCDWTGCLKPSEMTLTVTLIHDGRDGETKSRIIAWITQTTGSPYTPTIQN